ncbi:hypothetical protein ARMGADRAFT_756412 [Armillaria gallica]|uniref:Fibronectin type-III domain-containing protein n=1 Tax=Armillaria gallica TaxID=47427 RepID=A0A2H3DPJ1_ARMGA|nr:hypothetical protein ARMGADRAFT_756412 [Armillaria gallica]
MILLLLYVSLLTCILPVLSLVITVPTQPPLLVNASTSVLLTWSSDDPTHFFIAVQKILSPDSNVTLSMQPVENVTATCNVSVVFESAGKFIIDAIEDSPTQASVVIC